VLAINKLVQNKNGRWATSQGGFKNLQNRSRRRQSAHFSSIIGVLAPTAVGGYDFLKPPWPRRPMHNPFDLAPFRPILRPTKAMKSRLLLATALLLCLFINAADNFRCVTLTATSGSPATLQVQSGETAELVSSVSTARNGTVQMTFLRGNGGGGSWDVGIPVTGPATITAISSRDNTAIITVKITPDSGDVNKTHSLPPGTSQIFVMLESSTNQVYVTLGPSTNQVFVTLESSTNLVDWADATNGVYGNLDTLRFFRIRTKVLASP